MKRGKFKARFVRSAFIALGIAYFVAGLAFLSTGNLGGVSLGLLFLGGAALLFIAVQMLGELRSVRRYLERGARHDG